MFRCIYYCFVCTSPWIFSICIYVYVFIFHLFIVLFANYRFKGITWYCWDINQRFRALFIINSEFISSRLFFFFQSLGSSAYANKNKLLITGLALIRGFINYRGEGSVVAILIEGNTNKIKILGRKFSIENSARRSNRIFFFFYTFSPRWAKHLPAALLPVETQTQNSQTSWNKLRIYGIINCKENCRIVQRAPGVVLEINDFS